MKCFGCGREIEVGDRYIEDTASGFMKRDDGGDPQIDSIIADIFSGHDKVIFCQECTVEGGDYLYETHYGDDDE